MDKYDMIAKIVSTTGVSFEEAKTALEQHYLDTLEAVLALERAGKIKKESSSYTSANQTEETVERMTGDVVDKDGKRAGTTGEKAARFGASVERLFKTLMNQSFLVERKGEEIITLPVLMFLVVLILGINVTVPLLIVGLFCGCHYHFVGTKPVTVDINEMSSKASKYADKIKDSFSKKD